METMFTAFIGGLVAIVAAILIFRFINKKKSDDAVTPPPPPTTKDLSSQQTKSEMDIESIMESLVNLNITLRTSHGLGSKIITLIEEILDLLGSTVPQMIERHPSESLTFELKRISLEHLPGVFKEFIDLSPDSRTRQMDAFVSSLEDISNQVGRANEIVEQNELAEFKVMASFLKTKYAS